MTPPERRAADERWLRRAIALAENCVPSAGAFSVGCVIVDASGTRELATGFSRETAAHVHAEEVAIAKLDSADVRGAQLYSSLEPCSTRLSGRRSCADRILEARVARVIFALHEPGTFVICEGEARLKAAGVEVTVYPELGVDVLNVNAHLR